MTSVSPGGRWYGAKKDTFSRKDHHFMAQHPALMTAPYLPSTDFRDKLPPAYDQGQLGSCGPNSFKRLMAFLEPNFEGSRLGLYWDVRNLEGDTANDTGVQTRDLFDRAQAIGMGPEPDYPYIIGTFRQRPSAKYYHDAAAHRISAYSRLTTAREMLACLSGGMLFVSGFTVPASFESAETAKTGIFTMAQAANKQWLSGSDFVGGHDVTCCGHTMNFKSHPDFLRSGLDPATVPDHMLLFANSWGTGWGLNGYCWIPLLWIVDVQTGSDNWTCRK